MWSNEPVLHRYSFGVRKFVPSGGKSVILVGTQRSHFTRKVRLLLDHLEHPYRLKDMGNVADQDPERFGGNPLMSVPVLTDGDMSVFGSDNIASYLVRKLDPSDRFEVMVNDPRILNARSVLNGAMEAEVKLILAERTGLTTNEVIFFDKARHVIENVLNWCDTHSDLFVRTAPTYLQFHFLSFWEHLHLYNVVSGVWPRLSTIAEQIGASEIAAKSSPH